ncbi:MAG: Crp/Fnr family transcriptional regulator [Gammaproteobacteria bacterium]|nr:Crp/Fnr family transcriptional regulator [Gammaproteobacteria bacterium]
MSSLHPHAKPNAEQLKSMRSWVLFEKLSDAQYKDLQQSLKYQPLSPGETLFSQGDPVTYFYFVHTGQIKLTRLSKEGHEKVFEIVRDQQTFAEALMFARQPRYPVNAQAITETRVIAINAHAYLRILEKSTQACFTIMASMSQKLHAKVNEIDRLTLHNATYRLACWISDNVTQEDMQTDIQLNTPKNVIASQLSIKPETFSRTLKRLETEGLIKVHGNQIAITDIQQLRNSITAERL